MYPQCAGFFDCIVAAGVITQDHFVDEVARDHPHTRFACIDYAPPMQGPVPPNVTGVIFREEEGSYLVGAAAGRFSRSGAVGFVGGMDIPLIRRFENAWLSNVDDPIHARLRKLMLNAFSKPVVESLRPKAREVSRELLAAVDGWPGMRETLPAFTQVLTDEDESKTEGRPEFLRDAKGQRWLTYVEDAEGRRQIELQVVRVTDKGVVLVTPDMLRTP